MSPAENERRASYTLRRFLPAVFFAVFFGLFFFLLAAADTTLPFQQTKQNDNQIIL